jgi:D-alanine-D-alanine ligase
MRNIIVLFGGVSVEHDVSILTGITAINSLDEKKYNPIPVYLSRDGRFFTGKSLLDLDSYKNLALKNLIEVCFISPNPVLYKKGLNRVKKICDVYACVNCLHGGMGEDGSISGLMNVINIPTTCSNVLASSVSMDKHFTKIVLKSLNIKHLPSVLVSSVFEFHKYEDKLTYPIIVKPNLLGSSIGITRADNREQAVRAILEALKYGEKATIEPCLTDFIEINCAAYLDYNGKIVVSEVEKPIRNNDLLDFDDKYKSGEREFPANVSNSIRKKVRLITEKVYLALNMNGFVRIDFLVKQNDIYLNEINSVPGSLAYYLFTPTFSEFSEILSNVIERSVKMANKRATEVKTFDSGILSGRGTKGTKCLKKK